MNTVLLKRNKCIGCAICTDELPELFIMNEQDGKAQIIDQSVAQIQQKTRFPVDVPTLRIVQKCPVKAIEII